MSGDGGSDDRHEVSHGNRVIFPGVEVTKQQVADYYRKVADAMLPHIQGRPLTLRCFPEGIGEEGFFLKHAPKHFPEHIERIEVPMHSQKGRNMQMVAADQAKDLWYFASQNTVEVHVALSARDRLECPDQMIIDLDPSDDDFGKVRELALALRELLDGRDLHSFVKTTGSRGVHVHVPLRREAPFDEVKPVARRLAEELLEHCPDIATMEARKDKRGDRVFIDYLRNDHGMTAVAPYSLRARQGAPVAAPIEWKELERHDCRPDRWRLDNIFRRLGARQDPWRDFHRHRVGLDRLRS